MATPNVIPQQHNSFPNMESPAMQWVIRGAAGVVTHSMVTLLIPRDRQPVGLVLGAILGAGLSTSPSVLLQATGHGLLGGSATSTISYLVSGRT